MNNDGDHDNRTRVDVTEFTDRLTAGPGRRSATAIIIIIIIIIIISTILDFMVLSSRLRTIARVHPVHAMNAEQRQLTADL